MRKRKMNKAKQTELGIRLTSESNGKYKKHDRSKTAIGFKGDYIYLILILINPNKTHRRILYDSDMVEYKNKREDSYRK